MIGLGIILLFISRVVWCSRRHSLGILFCYRNQPGTHEKMRYRRNKMTINEIKDDLLRNCMTDGKYL